MICRRKPIASNCVFQNETEQPSQDRIQQLTAEIRKTWSPKTLASRAAHGSHRVDTMLVSALLFGDRKTPLIG